jgi:hypothetical protein
MRRPIFALLLLSLGFLSGCTVSQSPGLSPLQAEAEDNVLRRRSAIASRPHMGIPYPIGIGGIGAIGAVGGGMGGACP